ncbi:MAG: hypothetical protein CMP20_04560 [Rickettsiales bacterium]|nr:hypothetical protein [Rickettsiales bacterium]
MDPVKQYRRDASMFGKMRFPMVVSAGIQLCAVCVVMASYERLLACHSVGGAVLIRYVLPVVWLVVQFGRWVVFMLFSSTFDSSWRFMMETHKLHFVTKSGINTYKLLLYGNIAMIVLLGGYDAYLLLLSDEIPQQLFCETGHRQTHWTLVLALAFLIGFHAVEAQCLSKDLRFEERLIEKWFNASAVKTEEV